MATREVYCHNQSYNISYQLKNTQCEETILFLHGWGSNKELMQQAFSNTFHNFRHLYIDMPGFGNTNEPQEAIDSYEYATIVTNFLETLDIKPKIIFGHSFGGKIATLLNPLVLVLLSSAGIVLPKPLHVKVKIALFKSIKSLLPKNAYKIFASKDVEKMSEVMYGVFKKVVDEDFSSVFQNCGSKAFLFWGKEDTATPPISGRKIDQLIKNSSLYEIKGDHYFFLKEAKDVEIKVLRDLI